MLSVVAVALGAGAVGVGVAWARRRVDELGRPRPFPWVSVVLLLVPAVSSATPEVLGARQERRLAGAVSVLVGARV